MSTNTIEKILHDLSVKRQVRSRFEEDPDAVLAKYPLADGEADLIKNLEVAEMSARGVNPMLTMGFWMMMRGPQALGAYLAAMGRSKEEVG